MSIKRDFITSIHQFMSQNPLLLKFAISMNFHSRKIFKYHLANNSNINENGELLLINTIKKFNKNLDLIIDVGANNGEWINHFIDQKNLISKALLYEPNSFAYNHLLSLFSNQTNISINNAAVGEFEEEKFFYESAKASNLSSLISFNTKFDDTAKTLVKVVTLDNQLQKYGFTQADILKIDTEGYDLHVIKGVTNFLSQQKIGVIQFEYSRAWREAGSNILYAINLLEGYGYKVFLLKSDGLYSFNPIVYGEYYEYSNFVAFNDNFAWLEKELYQGII